MRFHYSYERTNTAAVKHMRLFFKLGQELSRLFLFIFDPDSGSQGMQWVFYPPNDGDRMILDFYKEPDRSKDDWDREMIALRDPGKASEASDSYLRTIPEMFISLLSQMKLRSTEKEFLNADWWYDMIDECN
ncbi:uncharacterized protein LOC142340781 [Convolutriloba macropyga]|uniref:uncharacterized protein LOC142340781 n=1 Tax=Convolutriloba macropyga TaxID=536237 RepID=UPI003F527E1B